MSTIANRAPRRHYRAPDAVAVAYQRLRGSASPGAAHQHELKIRAEAVRLMGLYADVAPARAGHFLADLEAASWPAGSALTRDAIRYAEECDAAEDESQTAFLLTPAPATARAWRIALETARRADTVLIAGLRLIEGGTDATIG